MWKYGLRGNEYLLGTYFRSFPIFFFLVYDIFRFPISNSTVDWVVRYRQLKMYLYTNNLVIFLRKNNTHS